MTIFFPDTEFHTDEDMAEISFPVSPLSVPVGPTPEHPVETFFCGEWITDNGEW